MPCPESSAHPVRHGGKSCIPWLFGGAAVLVVVLFVAAWYLLPVDAWIESLRQWIDRLGAWGPLVFGLMYVAAVVLLLPGSALTLAIGLTYGFWGVPIALAGVTIGASLAFLIARYLARHRIRALLVRRRAARAIETAINRGGFKIVALIRLSPLIPFNLQNYLFGVTQLRFGHYVAATFFGVIPGTLLRIYLGMVGGMAASGDSESLEWAGLAAGLAATVLVAWILTRKAKQVLAEAGVES